MASILETFYILFESNSKDVKKGTEEASDATKKLEGDIGHTGEAASAAGTLIVEKFVEVAGAIAAAFSVERVAAFITETATLNAELGVTAERLGINISDLDAYGQATERAGGSSEGFTQSLDFLNRGIADIATKGTSRLKPFFDELKIRVTDGPHQVRPLLDILGDLADKLSGFSAQQRAGIAEKLGLDEGTVLLLAQGRRGMADLVDQARALGVATQEDFEKAHAYKKSLEDLEQQFRHVATEIGSGILPRLEEFFKWVGRIIEYLSAHAGLVEGFFIGVAGVIATVYLPAALEAAAATWAFLAPILAIVVPIAAVGVAIGLLVDDVQNFLAGNKSVIGELSKSWPIIGETVREVVEVMSNALGYFFNLFESGWELVFSILAAVGALFASVFGGIKYFVTEFATNFAKVFPVWAEGFHLVAVAIETMVGWIAKAVEWFAKLGISALAALPKALHHWATDLDKLHGPQPPGSPQTPPKAAPSPKTPTPADQPKPRPDPGHAAGTPDAGGHAAPRPVVLRPNARPDAPQPASGPILPPASDVAKLVVQAQAAMKTADVSPLSAAGGAVSNVQGGNRSFQFNFAPTTIQVQNGDPQEIAGAFSAHLETQMRQAVDHFDDGIKK